MVLEEDIIEEVVLDAKLKDLNPIFFGYRIYFKGKTIKPSPLNFTKVHYIESGGGFFVTKNQKYKFGAGDVLIFPHGISSGFEITEETRSIYLGFDGELSLDFADLEPLFKSSPDIFNELVAAAKCEGRVDVLVSSILMKWYFQLFPKKESQKNDYVSQTKRYIEENYMQPITVNGIAKVMNVSRTYLSRIFKAETGKTVREYLISTRLKQSKHLINEGKNVTEAAFLCGFSSQSYFSKTYKRFYSETPKSQKKVKKK